MYVYPPSVINLYTRINEYLQPWLKSNRSGIGRCLVTKSLHDTKDIVVPLNAFEVNYRARNKRVLAFVEAVAIRRRSPNLCVQKLMAVNLCLSW